MINRFKLLMEQLKVSPSEFAERIGVQRSSISHVISGRNKPSIDFLEKILNTFPDIDANWLITGKSSSIKTLVNGDNNAVNEDDGSHDKLIAISQNKKPPVPLEEEPVDHVIIVYKNNTFRFLKPSGR